MYMYVYEFVYVYVYVYAYVYLYLYLCLYVIMYVIMYLYVYLYVYVYVYLYGYMYGYVYLYLYMYMYMCRYLYLYLYLYMYEYGYEYGYEYMYMYLYVYLYLYLYVIMYVYVYLYLYLYLYLSSPSFYLSFPPSFLPSLTFPQEEQAIQDSATIDRYRNLLLESQELMAQLKSEIERKDAESLDLIQKHNREADRINELQDRLAGPGSGRKNRLLDALVAIAEQQDRVDLAAEQARVAADAASRDPEQSGSAADAADAAQAERREANALLEQTLRGIGVEWPPREHVDALAEMEKIMTARLENPIARPIVTGAAAIAASPSVRFALDETDDETDETDETDEMVESDDEMMMQRPGNKMGKKAGKKTDDKRARDQARAVKQLEREVAEAQRSLQMMAALEDPVMRVKRLSESFAALHDNMFVRLKAAEERAERMQGINEQLYAKISSIAEQYVIDQQRNACRHCGATCKKCKGPSKKQMQQQNVAGNAANARNAAVTVIV